MMRLGRIFLLLTWALSLLLSASATVPDSFTSTESERVLGRDPFPLANTEGDFDDLNKLLEGAVVRLPDARVANDVVILYLRNIRCTNFTVQQVTLDSETVHRSSHDTFETTNVQLAIEGLDMICYLDYVYTFLFTRRGTADLYSYKNRASVSMDFTREMLVDSPATTATIEECLPTVNVNDLDFRGDIAAVVFDTVEKLMRNKVETEAEERLCSELNSLTNTLIADMLGEADESLATYYNVNIDPLQAEEELDVPDKIKLMDLRDNSRATAKWLNKLLAYAVDFATKKVTDGEGNEDMNLNVFIRENFLEEDGAFVVHTDELELLKTHNQFLDVVVVVDEVRIYGLDQIEIFEPFMEIGRYTVQNKVSWGLLTVEMDVFITLKASTKEDSVFASPSTAGTQEKIKVTFGIQNVDVFLSILLAVDEGTLGALRLGSLLYSDKVVDCLMSSVFDARISGLSLNAADIQPPIMEGFVARGIDRVVSDFIDAAFLLYESAMLDAAPGFFHSVVREFVNVAFADFVKVDVTCFIPLRVGGSRDGFTDFRDLFLPPQQALAAGGLGTQPYGDLPHSLVSQIKERFLANDKNGTPLLNYFLRDALKEGSDITDTVIELGDILDYNTTVAIAGFEALAGIQIFDVKLANLDTFGSPLHLFEPISGEAHMLNNSVSLGVRKPFQVNARLLISATDGDGLDLKNEVAVQIDLGSASFMAELFLQILEDPLFSVPIEDTLNPNCWLSTILPDSQVNTNLIASQQFSLDQLLLNITCVSCTSPEFGELIYSLYSPEEVGNATSKILNLVSLLGESDFFRVTTDNVLAGATRQCPHNSGYDPDFTYTSLLVERGGDDFQKKHGSRDEKAVYFNVASALVSVCVVLTFLGARAVARQRYRVWRYSLPDEARARLLSREEAVVTKEVGLNRSTQAMFKTTELPRHVRILVPIAIFATIVIQLIGHLAILSYVDIEGQVAGQSFTIRKFLVFKFVEASLRSYRNGGSEMAILLFVFTGIWPYLKLLTCFVLWFVSPERVSVSTRGSVFLWLDVFAKLSMVDILATLLAVAALLVYVGGASERKLSNGEFFATRVIIVPCAGFYCIVIAQRLTRISSAYLLNWHEQIISTSSSSRELKQADTSFDTFGTAETQDGCFESPPSNPEKEHFADEEIESNERAQSSRLVHRDFPVATSDTEPSASVAERIARFENNRREENNEPRPYCRIRLDESLVTELAPVPEPNMSDCETLESASSTPRKRHIRRVAIGMTGLTVLILAVVGMLMAPSVSIDAKTLWGIFESGKTFVEAVSEHHLFRIICSILVEARFVLDSRKAIAGLGVLLGLAFVSAVAFPILKCVEFARKCYKRRQADVFTREAVESDSIEAEESPSFIRRSCDSLMGLLKRAPSVVASWCRDQPYDPGDDSDMDLLPAYRMKAWRHLEVYVFAFVVAIWQLGAVSAYVLHQYCTILEMSFDTLVFLGLVQDTSTQCFREQASSPSVLLILASAFVTLMVSFLSEAIGQYKKIVAKAEKEIKEDWIRS